LGPVVAEALSNDRHELLAEVLEALDLVVWVFYGVL